MVTPAYKQFKSWAEEFDSATLEQKKMIACQLLKRVEVGRDYKISVELNMTYSQFCTEWNAKEFLDTLLLLIPFLVPEMLQHGGDSLNAFLANPLIH